MSVPAAPNPDIEAIKATMLGMLPTERAIVLRWIAATFPGEPVCPHGWRNEGADCETCCPLPY